MACNCGLDGYVANGLPSHSPADHGIKAVDPHVHDVALPDGSTIQTGPPIGGEVPPDQPLLEEPQTLRAKAAPLPIDDLGRVRAAVTAGKADMLPPVGSAIWQRMVESGLRYYGNDASHRPYIEKVAWRAVRQNYGLEPEVQVDAPLGIPTKAALPHMQAVGGRKYVLSGGTVPRVAGGAWVVPIADGVKDVRAGGQGPPRWTFESTDSVPVPGFPGLLVRVGLSNNGHRNILDVTVPKRLVGEGDGSGAAAASYVRKWWAQIWSAAKGRSYPDGIPTAKRAPQRYVKFVTTPEKAAERIAYGPVYVPWEIDLQGQYATKETVRRMAHRFMERHGKPGEMHSRWSMGDGARPYEIVESFIARDGDPHFDEGAWVIGAKFHPSVWEDIKSGARRGYSIGGRWGRHALAFDGLIDSMRAEVAA